MNAKTSKGSISARAACASLVVAWLALSAHDARAQRPRTFAFENRCAETVWVGALGNAGLPAPNGGGWALPAGTSTSIAVGGAWAGRFWGRRGCHFDASGAGACATGDCGGKLQCAGAGGVPPTSLAEFTLSGGGGADYYDVSLVDGYDFPIRVSPSVAVDPGNPNHCGSPTCTSDLLASCPAELTKRDASGRAIACLSACTAFGTDEYCCRGAYGSPQTCDPARWPRDYAAIFKSACPNEYGYAYDDRTSTFTCDGAPDYTITFCPSGGGGGGGGGGGIVAGAWYEIVNANSGKCVDDTDWRTSDGTPVQQYGCGNMQSNQAWQFVPTDSGYYRIVSRNAPSEVLDVTGGPSATASGVRVQLWGSWGGANQQWMPVPVGGGAVQLVARHSGKCLDVPGASIALGVLLQQWDCNGTGAQAFRLQSVP